MAAKILKILFCGCLAMLIWVGCNKHQQEKVQPNHPKESLTIGVGTVFLSAPLFIAREKGFFLQEGLNVTLKGYPSGKMALEEMFAGKVDMATVADIPVVVNSFKRKDFSLFTSFVHNYDDSKIIYRKDKGIQTPLDLKGKRIGVTPGTSAQFFLTVFLTNNGLPDRDVKMIYFPAQDLPEALAAGKVDAIAAFEPHATKALEMVTPNADRFPKITLYNTPFNMVTMNTYIKEHPDIIKRIIRALDLSIFFLKQNRTESIGIVSRQLKFEEKQIQTLLYKNIFGLSLDQSLLITLEDEARWMIRKKLTDKKEVPNYLDFIYLEGLKAVKPEAVTIIQ